MMKTPLLTLAAAAAVMAGCARNPPAAPMQPMSGMSPMQAPAGYAPYGAATYPAPYAPAPAAPSLTPAGITPVVPAPSAGIAGLEERQPDLCHAKDYTSALGQPGAAIAGLGVTREYRVVEYRGIEPQEYNPQRVVFRLDAGGNVYNIDCG